MRSARRSLRARSLGVAADVVADLHAPISIWRAIEAGAADHLWLRSQDAGADEPWLLAGILRQLLEAQARGDRFGPALRHFGVEAQRHPARVTTLDQLERHRTRGTRSRRSVRITDAIR